MSEAETKLVSGAEIIETAERITGRLMPLIERAARTRDVDLAQECTLFMQQVTEQLNKLGEAYLSSQADQDSDGCREVRRWLAGINKAIEEMRESARALTELQPSFRAPN